VARKDSEAKVTFKVFNQEFNKSIRQMKDESTKLRKEFQLQEEQLKQNGTESDRLAAKIEYLKKAQENAKKQVQATEQQLEKAKATFGDNSEEANKLARKLLDAQIAEQKLANQVNATEKELSQLSQQMQKATVVTDGFANSFEKAKSKINSAAKTLSTTATPAIAGIGAISVKSAADIDGATRQLIASLGATGDEAEQLEKTMKAVWEGGYADSADEVARAVGRVKQNMKQIGSGEELQTATEYALTLAKTFESDVNEVTRGANQLMLSFGLNAEQAFGLLTKGAQNGLNFSNELFDNVAEYGPLFKQMGFSAEQYFSILINGSENGAYNLDYINDAMKEFQIRVKDGSKSTSDAMGNLSGATQKVWKDFLDGKSTVADVFSAVIPELEKMDDQVKANQIGVALFGTKWEDLESDVMYSLDNQTDALKGFEGAIEETADTLEQSINQKAQATLRKLAGILAPLGFQILDLVNSVTPHIERLIDQFSGMNPVVQKVLIILGLLVAAAGPLLALIGQMTLGIGVLTQKFALNSASASRASASNSMYSSSLTKLGTTAKVASARVGILGKTFGILLGPFRLLGTLLMMFLPHLVMFIAENETARNVLSNVWNAIMSTIQPIIIQLMNAIQKLQPTFEQVLSSLGTVFSTLMKTVTGLLGDIGPSLTTLSSVLGSVFVTLIQSGGSLLSSLSPVLTGLLTLIGGVLTALQPVVQEFANSFAVLGPEFQETGSIIAQSFQALGPSFAELGLALMELGTTLGDTFSQMQPIFGQLGQSVGQVLVMLVQTFGQLTQAVLPIVSQLLPQLSVTFVNVLTVVLQIAISILPIVIQLIQAIIPIVMQIITTVLPMLLQAIQLVFPIILQIVQLVLPIVMQLLLSIVPIILNLAQIVIPLILKAVLMVFPLILTIIQTIIPIIITFLKLAATIITNVLIPAIQFILRIVQIIFPAILSIIQNVINIITNIIKLFTAVLRGDWSAAWNAIKNITSSVWSIIAASVSASINLIKTIITSVWNAIKSVTTSVWNGIKSAITRPIESAKNTIKTIIDNIKGFFSSLKLKIPDIKLPKLPRFSIEGKFSLAPPQVPKLKVNWNAEGGIFKKPTIFNTANAGLQGVGEAGPEAILPLSDSVLSKIGAMIAKTMEYRDNLAQTLSNSISVRQPILITVVSQLDGYEVARNQFEYINEMMGSDTEIKNLLGGNG